MKQRKYSTKLFVLGFLIGAIIYRFYLFIPSVILLIAGIFIKPCYYIGCILLLVDLIISFIWQKRIRNIVLANSDNHSIQKFQDAYTGDNPNEKIVESICEIIEEFEEDK